MANDEHVALLLQGPQVWNAWRNQYADTVPDLHGADLTEADLGMTNLAGANLSMAILTRANLFMANLTGANLLKAELSEANLHEANLTGANLTGADLLGAEFSRATLSRANLHRAFLVKANFFDATLAGANLHGANLTGADLINADLTEANLAEVRFIRARLIETNLTNANLTGCQIYGISAWNLKLEGTQQKDLIITREGESVITVDNLEVAQFIYLLLHHEKIRDVINTIGKKGVLILGRFTERKDILEALREELRQRNYVPIVFDFERPTDRDFTETVMTLAGMCLFIIADITKPQSVPLESQAIIPNYMIPFVPIIQGGEKPFAMFVDLWKKYREWVFEPLAYDSIAGLVEVFDPAVIEPAQRRREELSVRKAEELSTRHVKDYRKV